MCDVSDPEWGHADGTTDPPEKVLLGLAEQSADLFAVFDQHDRLTWANPAYCAAYNCCPADRPFWRDIIRANFVNARGPIVNTQDIEDWLTNAVARRAKKTFRCFEAELHGGRWIWITETVSSEGCMLFYASDITSLKGGSRLLRDERDTARRASWTDPLTGVPNRRYLLDSLTEWLRAKRAAPQFGEHSLAILDLDHFKQVNDLYGHDFGDKVLVSFCRDIVSHIRTVDLFGRIGGEEFLLFMPNCSIATAVSRLEVLRDIIGQGAMNAAQPTSCYSFSAGVVAVPPDEPLHDTIRQADKLLYKAKANGRGRVCSG